MNHPYFILTLKYKYINKTKLAQNRAKRIAFHAQKFAKQICTI